jgi:hypothetical protein
MGSGGVRMINKWVQLKDGVAFACVESQDFVGNSILLDEGMSFEDVHPKKYVDGLWVEAPLIYFVTQMADNIVRQINSTVYSSDVTGEIISTDVQVGWSYDGTVFTAPVVEPVVEPTE